MRALAGTGVAMPGKAAVVGRDADFSAYMQARQASLMRTAYLLSGDRHTAEDLMQTAFARLYLSWDKVRDPGSIDGYVRRILVNEHNSLWRRAWKRRELTLESVQGKARSIRRRRAVRSRRTGYLVLPDDQLLAILDAATGEPLVEWTSERGDRSPALVQSVVWEDDDTLLATVTEVTEQTVVRADLDGSLEQAAEPLAVQMSIAYRFPQSVWYLD